MDTPNSTSRVSHSPEVLLVHPPVVRPSEPPGGIATLGGALRRHGLGFDVLDANLEGLLCLIGNSITPTDTWSRRALKHREHHLHRLRDWKGYQHSGRYGRAVHDLNRLLDRTAASKGVRLSLGNFDDQRLLPTRSGELLRAAEHPEDNPFFPYFSKRLSDLLEEKARTVIGFSVNYLSQALCSFAMMGFLRKKCPRLTLIAGGGLITSWIRRSGWIDPFRGLVDHLVAGPGEGALLSMLHAGGGKADPDPGGSRAPDYSPFPLADYLSPGLILPYSASTGCYWNRCSFCPERAEGNRYEAIPGERLVADLQGLVDQYRPVLIHLTDNAISPAMMNALTSHSPGAPWYGFARFTRHLADRDFCLALKRSGCVMLSLGLESGDQQVLDALEKAIDLGEASSALKAVKRAEIATYVYLLFGTPAESSEEAWKTLDFVVSHREQIDFLNVALFNLPACGPDVHRVEKKIFYEGDLSLYVDFEHPRGWNRKEVRQFLDREFRRHPAVKPILRRDPPVFTSSHAPFFSGLRPSIHFPGKPVGSE